MILNLTEKIAPIACGLLCCCSMVYAQGNDTSEVMLLDTGWEFSQSGTEKWMPATVPGTVHQDLISHELLPNPFYGMNEKKIQWVENEDWEYRTSFIVSEEQLNRDGIQLIFEGLDTYADVYLNGSLLLKADNMFVGYTVPVKSVLRKGENHLYIYFHSPIRQTLPQYASNGFNYPADNDHHEKHLSVFTRKAPYSYGWDWGIRMVTSGVWRPVTLRFYDVATISDYHVRQVSLTDETARLSNELIVNQILSQEVPAEVRVRVSLDGTAVAEVKQQVKLQPGINHITLPSEVTNPVRWMPNGWGEPALYDFEAVIKVDGKVIASQKERIGLRTIKVVKEKDDQGESFYFIVNGEPMFAKGANFIPDDALLPNITEERYRQLFKDVKDANMNMIRVWGGGIYEDDAFYQAADENGILVWQDFIFACTTYPSDPAFMKRVEAEAEYNIKRLRNHASLAMWCGNNEIYEGMRYWGWDKKYTDPGIMEGMKQGYDKLFRELLPRKVAELDPDRFYMHGSPYEANWGRPESWKIADSHNWGIWYGQKPFESLDTEIPRFMSEFGFQAFPEMKTIATFASPEDYALESEVMNAHQKATIGNFLIKKTMGLYYKVPEDFDQLVYMGLVLQGVGVRQGLEAHRRNRPYCMGTLYWQLNDSWPVVSWSSIDYYGNWKALHYQAKRAFAPVLVDAVKEGEDLNIYVMSDKLEADKEVTLLLRVMDFNGKVLTKKSIKGEVPANASTLYYKEPYAGITTSPQNTFLLMTLKNKKGEVLSEEIYYFNHAKDQELPKTEIRYKVKPMDGKYEVTLSARQLARDVFIEIPVQGVRFTDNFFDLLPGQTKKVIITSDKLKKNEKVDITIKQLSDTN